MKKSSAIALTSSLLAPLLFATPAFAASGYQITMHFSPSPTVGTQETVSGQVTDNGSPVSGALVQLKGTPNSFSFSGMSTNAQGDYSVTFNYGGANQSAFTLAGPETETVTATNSANKTLASDTQTITVTPWPPASDSMTTSTSVATVSATIDNTQNASGAKMTSTVGYTVAITGSCIAPANAPMSNGASIFPVGLDIISGTPGTSCTVENSYNGNVLGKTTFTIPKATTPPAPTPQPTPKPTPKPRPVLPFVNKVTLVTPSLSQVFLGQKLIFSGTATMNSGLPAANTTVTIGYNSRQNVTTTTNSQGQFSFSITPKTPGKSTIFVSDGLGSQTIPITVNAIVPAKIVLNIQKTATANGDITVNGVVLNNNGTPAFGQTVQINVGQNQQYAITSDFQGKFSLTEPVFTTGQETVIAETDGIVAKTQVTVVKPTPKPNPTPAPQPVVNPQPKPNPTTPVVPSQKFDPIAVKWYTVQPGDNLWNISKKFYGTVWDYISIAQINHIANPALIYLGEKLKLENMEW